MNLLSSKMPVIQRSLLVIIFFASRCALAGDFPPVAALPSHPEFPDPLMMLDGSKITSASDWLTRRRPELKELFQHYMYGYLPPKPQKIVVEEVLFSDSSFLGGKATISESRLAFFGPDLKNRLYVMLIVPNHRKETAPVFLALNFCGNYAVVDYPKLHVPEGWTYKKKCHGSEDDMATEEGRGIQVNEWNLDLIIDRGYAFAGFRNGDLDPDSFDFSDGIEPGFYAPGQTEPKPDDPGAIATWAWGFHRVADFLIDHHSDKIDVRRMITVGHSRNGKTALLAAAMDERFALAIPHQAGCGGSAPSRIAIDTEKAESVAEINKGFPHWFCDNFLLFDSQPDKLPFDQHCLVALCAPRPVLMTNAVEDRWANPAGQFDILKEADKVYRFLNAGGLDASERPELGHLINSKLGYYIRTGSHSMNREDWNVFLDFADKQLGKP